MPNKRTINIDIFNDSITFIKETENLKKALKKSLANQKLYLEKDEITIPANPKRNCKTLVSGKRSFEAASRYAREGKKVCVLNFASATNPGGGVTRGSSAQEEGLCRCSTLYPCLDTEDMWRRFYLPHRRAKAPLYNDDCIYTPGVVVFKSDTVHPELMQERDWYQVDVITCAAPNLRAIPSNLMNPYAGDTAADIEKERLYELHLHRMERIMKIAAANGAEALILGAFGCGAFCNPPEIVAEAWKTIQSKYEGYFETIEYAVFCSKQDTSNYDTFSKVFDSKKTFDLSRFSEAHAENYQKALAEVKAGCKRTHWMWYIFPQIAGLGMSPTSRFYAIANLEEAKAYLKDPVLGAHTLQLCQALLQLESRDAAAIFGWPDDMKLKSCMTLFEQAEPEQPIFGRILDEFFMEERDQNTIEILKKMER